MSQKTVRLGLIAAVATIVMVAASSAGAALKPTFAATTTADATVISYAQGPGDDPLARLTFFVASGYDALLSSPEGEVVGKVTARAVAGDLGGAAVPLNGAITVGSATTTITSSGSSVTLAAAAAVCTGTATHSAFWIVSLTASGQTVQVPVFVDDVPLTVPLSAIANNTITVCLPPPDVPAGTPGRATLGLKLVSVNLEITEIFSPAPGFYTWHATATPYSPGTGKANAAGTVDLQSIDRTPQEVSLKARAVKGKTRTATVSGRVLTGGRGVSGVDVSIRIGKRVVAKLKTKAAGAYARRITLPTATATLTATATAGPRPSGTCVAAFPPIPCAGSWVSGFTATSTPVRVRT